jgi:8-oxo-dGTP diphosphatase
LNPSPAAGDINVVAVAIVRAERLLVVRKQSGGRWILPGGKPETGESEVETVYREVEEELSCTVSNLQLLGQFVDQAAHQAGARVWLTVYTGQLEGTPRPGREIERLRWSPLTQIGDLAPVHTQINPILAARFGRPSR